MTKAHTYETKKVGKYTVKVYQDDDPLDPRTEWDNLATMVCFHRNYKLGDKHYFSDPQDEDLISLLKRKDILWLPLYLYDHSGITISTDSFSCHWDSGQVGYIYIEKSKYREAFSCKHVNKKDAYDLLRSEVKCYDDYLTGNVYGFIVEDETGSVVESCWGFFGEIKYCLEEGINMAQACIRHDIRQHVKIRKVQIKNRVPLHLRLSLQI